MNSNRSPAPVLNTIARGVNTAVNSVLRTNAQPTSSTFGNETLLIAIVSSLAIAVGITIYMFWDSVVNIFEDVYNYFASVMGTSQINIGPSSMPVQHLMEQPSTPQVHIQEPPVPAQPVDSSQNTIASNIVNQILPERRQVFNISANRYTYYDAEPLCKALGAELATYDQVKQAYENGAEWCNVGWSAGQMGLYPTQEATWLKLQKGSEEQRRSCGKPGVNGGVYDNAELRFSVNCYGIKPAQKPIDQLIQTSGETAPMTPEMIEFDKKVSKYKGLADTIAIMPYNNQQWSA
jgi:hypothetical protein